MVELNVFEIMLGAFRAPLLFSWFAFDAFELIRLLLVASDEFVVDGVLGTTAFSGFDGLNAVPLPVRFEFQNERAFAENLLAHVLLYEL